MKRIIHVGMTFMLTSFMLLGTQAQAQWSPPGTSTSMEIGRTGKVRLGMLSSSDNSQLGIISNLASNTLTNGDFTLVTGDMNVDASSSSNNGTGKIHGRIGSAGTFSSGSLLYGIVGSVYDLTRIRNIGASISTAQGAAFSLTINNPIPSGYEGLGTYLMSGTRTSLNGSITNYPTTGIVAALLAEDNINGTGTWAGYFQGRGYFSGNVGIGTLSPSAKLHVVGTTSLVGNTTITGVGVVTQQLKVKSTPVMPPTVGIAVGAEYIGTFSEAGNILPGMTETYGVWGQGHNGHYLTVGVHGDGFSDNGQVIGVWGSAYGGGSASYGVYGDVSGGSASYAGYFDGDVYASGTYTSSDLKLKKDIQPLTGAMDIIAMLAPKSYEFRTGEFPTMNLRSGRNMGFIAQDLEKVLPSLVKDTRSPAEIDKDGKVINQPIEFKAVDYVSLVPVLVAGMQEQQEQIEAKNERIAELEERLDKLEALAGVDKGSLSAQAVLQQNEPNPFSQRTEIRFTLPSQMNDAQLLVFDMNGKQIKHTPLRNGDSKVTINGSELSAGMYLYSLIVNGQEVDTKRMILTQ